MKSIIFGFVTLVLTAAAGAANADDTLVIHDKPGFFLHLDIDKVLTSTDRTSQCGIVPARLDYLDHTGQEHVLDYQLYGEGCTD